MWIDQREQTTNRPNFNIVKHVFESGFSEIVKSREPPNFKWDEIKANSWLSVYLCFNQIQRTRCVQWHCKKWYYTGEWKRPKLAWKIGHCMIFSLNDMHDLKVCHIWLRLLIIIYWYLSRRHMLDQTYMYGLFTPRQTNRQTVSTYQEMHTRTYVRCFS